MNTNQTYFSSRRSRYIPNVPEYDKDEHWSVMLDRRPIGRKYGKGYPPSVVAIDQDTRTDNWDIDPTREEQ